MSVSYFPGPPQFGQGGGQDPAALAQLAMQVKKFKMQEAEQKKQAAQEKVNLLLSNPQLMLMSDPKDLEKAFKEGFGIKFNKETPTDPNAAVPTQAPAQGGGSDVPPAGPKPQDIAAVGNAVQGNKAGAASGTPPSSNAANKAPGSGVNPSIMSPSTVEEMAGQAHQQFNQKFGAVAPLYAGAMSQVDQERLKAHTIAEIERLKQNAIGGDMQSMGKLMFLSGKQVTDADMRNMIISSNMDPKIIQQAMDFALGNETPADRAKRFDSTLKTLASQPDIMSKLSNPLDITKIAQSVVNSGQLPEGINMKPLSLDELTKEADYEKYLITDVGLPYDVSHTISRARSLGLDTNLSMPTGFQSLAQRKVGATEKQASASMLAAQADMVKATAEFNKVTNEIKFKVNDPLIKELEVMIEADKAKHSFPDDVKSALINKLAERSGLMPEKVKKWYQYLTGGSTFEYKPNPDEALAKAAAGGPMKKQQAPKGKPSQLDQTFDRTMQFFKEVMGGKPTLDQAQ